MHRGVLNPAAAAARGGPPRVSSGAESSLCYKSLGRHRRVSPYFAYYLSASRVCVNVETKKRERERERGRGAIIFLLARFFSRKANSLNQRDSQTCFRILVCTLLIPKQITAAIKTYRDCDQSSMIASSREEEIDPIITITIIVVTKQVRLVASSI